THELPSNYDRRFGLQNNLRNAIIEYAQIIESNLNNHRYIENSQQYNSYALIASILKKFYYEKQTIDSIAQKEACTHEYVDIVKNNCLSDIISGNTLFKNYRLNRDLLDLIQSLKSECLFESIHTFEVYSGSKDTSFLKDLGLDFLAIKDVIILIPKYTKLIYNTVWKKIYYTLLEYPLPTNREVIYQLVIDNDDLSDVEFDPLFVEKVLACDKIVDERDNNTIQIKDEYLTNSAQRCARIVFEAGQKLTTEELINRYESIYQKKPNIIYRKVHEYGINCEGKRYWYFGQPKTSLQQRISEYAEKNGIFFYCELEQALKNDGYTIPPTIRTYITNVCAVDNKDLDHFCFKDYVDDYSNYSWRNPSKYGWANWVFNEIRCILLERGTVPYREMIDELENRSHTTEYIKIRHRLQVNNMSYFCGEDKPFVIVDGNVVINQPIYDKTEFETIGLRGGKYAYYKQIRSLVANEVKKAEAGKMRLTDVINLVNETVVDNEPLNRGVIIRAIEDKQNRFAPIDIEIVSESGGLYVQWTKQDINPDPVYVVSSTDDSTQDDYVVEAEEQTDNRPNISYRQVVDWSELTRILKRELSFCKSWLHHEGYDLNTAIDSFIRLIKQSSNHNLNSRLPQDLYEYWFARTDGNDRYRYLTDLLLFFEGVLAEIY
ncbi:MAG: hypothetical protein II670_10830, partial [Alphaproteobacteria bacterium]|nr:hypothetical protein [Alphaproteobacteria bacterium]